jgi:hypothetical protein
VFRTSLTQTTFLPLLLFTLNPTPK